MMEAKWIQFQEIGSAKPRVTKIWQIGAKDVGPTLLGEVKWFGRWRKYAFFPYANTVFEQDCLRDIAQFCQEQTREHRQKAA